MLYRPPDANVSAFIDFLDRFSDFVSYNKCKLALCGDLNVDMIAEAPHQFQLQTTVGSNGISNIIETPTRVTCNSSTLIGLCTINIDE